jgi:hypothetical protein
VTRKVLLFRPKWRESLLPWWTNWEDVNLVCALSLMNFLKIILARSESSASLRHQNLIIATIEGKVEAASSFIVGNIV